MKILVAEDDIDVSSIYKRVLEKKGHSTTLAENGEDCLKFYGEHFESIRSNDPKSIYFQPFDVVLLDYKMPRLNGLDVAKEILALNPRQRIVFASAYLEENLIHDELNQEVELLSKPFSNDVLVSTIEGRNLYYELEKLGVDTPDLKAAGFTHKQLAELIRVLKGNYSDHGKEK